jgi:hypothetical protein
MERDEFTETQRELAEETEALGLPTNGDLASSAIQRLTAQIQQVAKVAADMEKLTGDHLWDEFLSILKAAENEALATYESLREKADSPMVANAEELMRLKLLMTCARERMSVLRLIAGIPADLRKHGETTKEMLNKLPAISDDKPKKGLFGRRS